MAKGSKRGWWMRARAQPKGSSTTPKDCAWGVVTTVVTAFVTTGTILYAAHLAPRLHERLPLHYNASPSLPRGFYSPTFPDTIVRGDLLRVCLPEANAPLALERRYVSPGRCPGRTEPLAKMLVGMPGDTVHVDSAGVRIGATLQIHAPAAAMDSRGRPVAALRGTYVMPTGQCFVLSTYVPQSYDSRYFGPVDCVPPHVVLTATAAAARAAIGSMRRDMLGGTPHAPPE